MPIKIKHGEPATQLTAAAMAGQARKQEKLEIMQLDFDYKKALREQDMAIDLEMDSRAKLWEIEKLEISSRIDFQREEQKRQLELDNYDNVELQIKKEIQAGRMTDKEAEPYLLKNDLARQGMNISVSEIQRQKEDEKYGVQPHWMKGKDAPIGSPERMLYEAEMKRRIEGTTGTVPYHLSSEFLRSLPSATAQEMLEDKGIFFDSDEEFEAWLVSRESATPTELPLGNKFLDVGIRADVHSGEEIRVISPTGDEGTIPIEDLEEALATGYTRADSFRRVGATGTWEEPAVEPPRPKRKPRLGTINWKRLMSKGFK